MSSFVAYGSRNLSMAACVPTTRKKGKGEQGESQRIRNEEEGEGDYVVSLERCLILRFVIISNELATTHVQLRPRSSYPLKTSPFHSLSLSLPFRSTPVYLPFHPVFSPQTLQQCRHTLGFMSLTHCCCQSMSAATRFSFSASSIPTSMDRTSQMKRRPSSSARFLARSSVK